MRGRIASYCLHLIIARHRGQIKFDMSLTTLLLRRLENKGRAVADVWPREDMYAWCFPHPCESSFTLILSNTCLHSVVYQVILREHLFSIWNAKYFRLFLFFYRLAINETCRPEMTFISKKFMIKVKIEKKTLEIKEIWFRLRVELGKNNKEFKRICHWLVRSTMSQIRYICCSDGEMVWHLFTLLFFRSKKLVPSKWWRS